MPAVQTNPALIVRPVLVTASVIGDGKTAATAFRPDLPPGLAFRVESDGTVTTFPIDPTESAALTAHAGVVIVTAAPGGAQAAS